MLAVRGGNAERSGTKNADGSRSFVAEHAHSVRYFRYHEGGLERMMRVCGDMRSNMSSTITLKGTKECGWYSRQALAPLRPRRFCLCGVDPIRNKF